MFYTWGKSRCRRRCRPRSRVRGSPWPKAGAGDSKEGRWVWASGCCVLGCLWCRESLFLSFLLNLKRGLSLRKRPGLWEPLEKWQVGSPGRLSPACTIALAEPTGHYWGTLESRRPAASMGGMGGKWQLILVHFIPLPRATHLALVQQTTVPCCHGSCKAAGRSQGSRRPLVSTSGWSPA
jgi:hypothetical protein